MPKTQAPQFEQCPRHFCRRIAVLTGGVYSMLEIDRGERRDSKLIAARCPEHGIVMIRRGAVTEEPTAVHA